LGNYGEISYVWKVEFPHHLFPLIKIIFRIHDYKYSSLGDF
jgi:hypothetical protein